MFIGEYRHSIDEKGRLQVPTKWRPKLADGAVITKGFDGSLKFYPVAAWQEIAARLAELPQSEPNVRAYVRQTLAGAVDVELDKLGRVVIPGFLRRYANLTKQTVFAGLQNHMEIWDEESWNRYIQDINPESPEFSHHLQELGI